MLVQNAALKIAVFASGEGTTLGAIARACHSGRLNAEIVLAVCNNRDSGALRRAKELSIPYAHLSSMTHPALLPKFGGHGMYGHRVHETVLASGDKVTGVSVPIVNRFLICPTQA